MSVAPYLFTDVGEVTRRSPHAPLTPLLQPVRLPVTEPPFDDEIGLSAATPIPRYGRAPARPEAMTPAVGYPTPHRSSRPAPPTLAPGLATVVARGDIRVVTAPGRTGPELATGALSPHALTAALPQRTLPHPAPTQPVSAPPTLRLLPGGRVRPAPVPATEAPEFGPGALVRIGGPAVDRAEQPEDARLASLPDPRPLAGQVAQAVVEVLAGDRPLSQLLTWLDERIYTELAALAPRPPTSPAGGRARASVIRPQDRPKVRSVHVTRPAPGVAEVAARVQTNGRSRAVALRLEEWRGRWRCCALVVG